MPVYFLAIGATPLFLAQSCIQFIQQFCVGFERALQNPGLLLGGWPVLPLDRFGQAGQFQMRVGEAGAVEDVFESGTAGDAVGIEPVALDLHHTVIERLGEFGIDLAGC